MRPIISYDDISLPYEPPPDTTSALPPPHSSQPHQPRPSKKRKRNNNYNNHNHNHNNYNQNSRGNSWQNTSNNRPSSRPSGDTIEEYEDEDGDDDEDDEEESRTLTHEEIWDDSALIEAWNAAAEEYEAYHGPDKDWKKEPVHKSPLWYNTPPQNPKPKPKSTQKSSPPTGAATSSNHANGNPVGTMGGGGQREAQAEGDIENSTPVDFDAFVPTHDPTLGLSVPPQNGVELASPPPGPLVSQDEAFSKALGAMYWAGYWTAAYHYSRKATQSVEGDDEEDNDEGGAEDADVFEDQDEDMLPTQR